MPGLQNWEDELLRTAADNSIAGVIGSLHEFLAADGELFGRGTHERTMSGLLACHLRRYFSEWNVDPEFDRDAGNPAFDIKRHGNKRVVPDIIVHRRGTTENLLVIEIKQSPKAEESAADRADVAKLRRYLSVQGYQYALFLKFISRHPQPGLWRAEWITAAPAA